jgi:hypothetical protein
MFKDYIVVDDIFEDPFSVVEKSKQLEYYVSSDCTHLMKNYEHLNLRKNYLNSPDFLTGSWKGFRTESLHKKDQSFFNKTMNEIFVKILNIDPAVRYDYRIMSHFFIIPNGLKSDERWMHTDPSIFAGVVYLNPNPDKDAGTTIELNGEKIKIENKFNRLLAYNSKIKHAPTGSFQGDIEDRLVLTFFVGQLRFLYTQQ